MAQIIAKEVGDADGLALVEWEDGSITLRPVIWESDLSMLIDPETQDFWFARGRGSEPKDWNGIPVWRVYAGNAGVISTEACLIGDAERWDDVIDVGDGDTVPDELFDLGLEDPNGGRTHADTGGLDASDLEPSPATATGNGAGEVRADGGAAAANGGSPVDVPDGAAIYDLRPPQAADGVAIDVRDADDFDPFPVNREDAKAAAEWFERATGDETDTWMKGFIVGIVVTVVLALIFLGGPWLASQLAGGGGGGGGGGSSLPALLSLLAVPAQSAREKVRTAVSEVV